MLNTDKKITEIYQNIVGTLSVSDRLRLAAMILNDISQQNIAGVDKSNTWTEQDQLDITSFSLQYAALD
ncbi:MULTISPECIES: hypothetical protein [Planktothricoides]|uniref:Uncharacterized protein n=1 Tax=Planktothricoides raciborskii FACHB-1370 TaxID=2949576 RepID=A0ABR8EEU0_9CYAN|nr:MULTISPECIES: hypothetical protein [Planktothricoides]KOR37661.1 hypothetical protein AM228_05730 [Planktothricoides sp. SR001]MBD2544082.1 hypothetical protein [Planktothricoides raciborskii FACHB-1370]MBD2582567.1 hypothetical protein [Planktothricoides raciborskii FACHB-1261]